MEKTIELVNLWGEYARTHANAEIEDFCRQYLTQKRENIDKGPLVGGVVPSHTDGLLMKIIGRIHKLHVMYATAAFEGTPLNQLEEFGCLVTIQRQKNPKKSEVIYSNLMELSSGTDMLNRLKNKGLIKEQEDKEDKRSKRVLLTAAGERATVQCLKRIEQLAEIMLHDMPQEDKLLCIQLLKHIEIKFSGLFQKHKGESFENVYSEIVTGPVTKEKRKSKA
ncbi:MarR family winged helix-turn-helix transcriptional regulator [Chitinophagaceae bacterium MMS25-I14]